MRITIIQKIIDIVRGKEKYKVKDFYYQDNRTKNTNVLKYLERYMHAVENDLPCECSDKNENPIWQLWLQGEDNMPPIVRFCTESVKKENPNRKVILLSRDNLKDYISLPDYIIEKYDKKIISNTHFSDIVRLFLLYQYGGTWVDSTIYMSGKIPDEIENQPLYFFRDLTSILISEEMSLEEFVLCNDILNLGAFTNSISFIHAKKGNKILADVLKVVLETWKYENECVDYLFMSYILTAVLFQNPQYKQEFMQIPYHYTTLQYGLMQDYLYKKFDKNIYELIKGITPIHKLTYKKLKNNKYKNSFYNYFISQLNEKQNLTNCR